MGDLQAITAPSTGTSLAQTTLQTRSPQCRQTLETCAPQEHAPTTHQADNNPSSARGSQFESLPPNTRVLILGGGTGGTSVAVELGRLLKHRTNVEVTLVNRDNFYLMAPLFEAASGSVEVRHVVNPIRPLLTRSRLCGQK